MPHPEATETVSVHREDLGTQCQVAAIRETCLGFGLDGDPLWFAVLDGSPIDPTYLVAVEPRTGRIAYQVAIDELTGPKAVVQARGGDVFLAGYHPGQLYRWQLGAPTVEALGLPMPDVQFIWSLAAGADGSVYGGTWPTGAAFRWHPDDGFAAIGEVPIAPDIEYVRCVAVDPVQDFLIIGSGTPAGCLVVDLRTGDQLRPVPEAYADASFVYDAEVRDGLVSIVTGHGDATIFRILRGDSGLEAEAGFTVPDGGSVAPAILDPDQGLVAVHGPTHGISVWGPNGLIRRYDGIADSGARRLHPSTDGQQLHYLGPNGSGTLHLDDGTLTKINIDELPKAAQAISALSYGPGNRLTAGGFLNGGVMITELDTGERTQLGPIGQPEGFGVWGDALVVGAYPGARLHVLSPESLTSQGFRPDPIATFDGAGQDRPYAFAARDHGHAYVGFMAYYGLLPGAVVELRRDGDAITTGEPWFDVGDRSVLSLLVLPSRTGDLLYGTTMIDGGMGIRPTEERAVLFRRNLQTGVVDHWTPPTPRCRAIHSIVEHDGRLAMFAEHQLVIFDPADESWQVIDLGVPEFPTGVGIRMHAHEATLRLHPNGSLYATVHGVGLLRIDPPDFRPTVLWSGPASHLAIDADGGLIFADASTLRLVRLQEGPV